MPRRSLKYLNLKLSKERVFHCGSKDPTVEKIPDTVAKKGETGEESDEEHAGRLYQHPYHRGFVPQGQTVNVVF